MNQNLVGNIYMDGRFCIKQNEGKMSDTGSAHWKSMEQLKLNLDEIFMRWPSALFMIMVSIFHGVQDMENVKTSKNQFIWK